MKKSILTIFIFILTINFGLSQTASDLEVKNGFKDIKLDESFQKWKPALFSDYIKKDDNGNIIGVLANSKSYDVFGYKVNSIVLTFQNEKISQIEINLEHFQDADVANEKFVKWRADDFETIYSNFNSLFGKGEKATGEKYGCDIIGMWVSESLVLDLRYYNFGVSKYDQCRIWLSKKSFLNSKIKSGF